MRQVKLQKKINAATDKAKELGISSNPNKYVQNKVNILGKPVHKEISENKFNRVSSRYKKQEGSEELGTNKSIAQQVVSGKNPKNSVSRKDTKRSADLKRYFE